jgi:hypothetical protein
MRATFYVDNREQMMFMTTDAAKPLLVRTFAKVVIRFFSLRGTARLQFTDDIAENLGRFDQQD